jgi:hypothetical protein
MTAVTGVFQEEEYLGAGIRLGKARVSPVQPSLPPQPTQLRRYAQAIWKKGLS